MAWSRVLVIVLVVGLEYLLGVARNPAMAFRPDF